MDHGIGQVFLDLFASPLSVIAIGKMDVFSFAYYCMLSIPIKRSRSIMLSYSVFTCFAFDLFLTSSDISVFDR